MNTLVKQLEPIETLPRLGIGLLDNPALFDFYQENLNQVDYVSVIPDMFRIDRGLGLQPRFKELEAWVELVDWLANRCPLIAHSIGLSIGTAGHFDLEYLEQMAYWHSRYDFPWHSEHLSFVNISGANSHIRNVGLAAPVPYDYEFLELLTSRIKLVQNEIPIPFLLENNVYYVEIPEQEMTEAQFLNQLFQQTGSGLLLDLHNLYANSINHGFEAIDFIDKLDLSYLVEIHVAGGNYLAGLYVDSHSGQCPEAVWNLLDEVIPRAPNLRGITFEFHESYYPLLRAEGVIEQLRIAREIWRKFY